MNAPHQISREEALAELQSRADAEGSLYEFFKQCWPVIEPGNDLIDCWALGAMCEHVQYVLDGHIKNLRINVPPRFNKPVHAEAVVTERMRGLILLKNIKRGDYILTHKGEFRQVMAVHRQPDNEVLKIEGFSGRVTFAAPDHPFLTPGGWVEAGALTVGDSLAVVHQSEPSGTKTISPEEARLLGYLVGDGHCANTPNITCADDIEASDIRKCVESMGWSVTDVTYKMTKTGASLRRISIRAPGQQACYPKGQGRGRAIGPVRRWMQSHDIHLKNSYTKRVPASVLAGDLDTVINFLGAYWACDGHISKGGFKRGKSRVDRSDVRIGCVSVSKQLMIDIQTLLARVGVSSNFRRKEISLKTKKQGDTYVSYSLLCKNQDAATKFLDRIPIHHGKIRTNGHLQRTDFDRVILPDPIVSIEKSSSRDCICLEVEEHSSFVADGYAVHNTKVCSIAAPAWQWTHKPSESFVCGSYAFSLARDNSLATRALLASPYYQQRWGSKFSFLDGQDRAEFFANNKGGQLFITSPDSILTGRGASTLILDDPNHTKDQSDTLLDSTLQWWRRVIPTRVKLFKTAKKIVIQQRTHEKDISGDIEANFQEDFVHLILPMEFESDRKCVTVKLPSTGDKKWEDPRTKDGQLLAPELVGPVELKFLKKALGSTYDISGQLQQKPSPGEGGMIKKSWFPIRARPHLLHLKYTVLSFDTSLSDLTTSAYNAATTWGVFEEENTKIPNVILLSQWRERCEYNVLLKRAQRMANDYMDDKESPLIKTNPKRKPDIILVEDQGFGKELIKSMLRLGHPVLRFQPRGKGDKKTRVRAVQPILEGLRCWLPGAPPDWKIPKRYAELFRDQACAFPVAASRDLVDTMTQALYWLQANWFIYTPDERPPEERKPTTYERKRIYGGSLRR